eukprot:5512934-Amphidinium_carterae.1
MATGHVDSRSSTAYARAGILVMQCAITCNTLLFEVYFQCSCPAYTCSKTLVRRACSGKGTTLLDPIGPMVKPCPRRSYRTTSPVTGEEFEQTMLVVVTLRWIVAFWAGQQLLLTATVSCCQTQKVEASSNFYLVLGECNVVDNS